ncbi:hypothetical protein M4578_22105 [Salipiger sp. P9]|uniref:ABC transporter substrate-binding protein n=1 Tax=Salipiger pentaromativorans TaxID=2943193 RepID=UPI00215877F4|nr:hypothetical protein [Salipiger pentaromativorans]MCR8550525.1 hypothetical protein [Salipiger pentaromativorans]
MQITMQFHHARSALKRATAGVAALVLGGLVLAQPAAAQEFEPSSGTEIPEVDVNLAMWPYANNMLGIIGLKQGWFEEVGIALPEGDAIVSIEQSNARLTNGELDASEDYVPALIEVYASMPHVQHVLTMTTFVGQHVLANPELGVRSWSDFIAEGQTKDEAFRSVIGQMRGKRVVFSTNAGTRPFVNTILELGGLTTADVEVDVLADSRIVQLAQSGQIDFAIPGGAAQNVQVQDIGYQRMVGVPDLIAGLPAGDSRVINAFGFGGLTLQSEMIAQDRETVLRLVSVYYRILDQIENDPNTALSYLIPYLSAATGEDVDLGDLERLWTGGDFYVPWSFGRQAELEADESSELYYEAIIGAQIAAAQAGGVVPAALELTADKITAAPGIYKDMVALKEGYETLLADHPDLSGALVEQAAAFYDGRNYLDAYRFLRSAAEGE